MKHHLHLISSTFVQVHETSQLISSCYHYYHYSHPSPILWSSAFLSVETISISYENYECYIYLSKLSDFVNVDWHCQSTCQLTNYQLTNLPTCQLLVITITWYFAATLQVFSLALCLHLNLYSLTCPRLSFSHQLFCRKCPCRWQAITLSYCYRSFAFGKHCALVSIFVLFIYPESETRN